MTLNDTKAPRRKSGLCALMIIAASLAGSVQAIAESAPTDPPSGTVSVQQLQLAFIASGALGGGSLHFQGRTYKFKIGGLGIGGFGASKFSATGEVYGLKDVADFAGPYGEIRTGWAIGDNGKGKVWLRNAKGVMLSLKGERQGLQLAAGAEGVIITLD